VRPVVLEKESMLGVALSSAARVRFGRLRDLIGSYALEEVEGYLEEKDGLVAMVSGVRLHRIRVDIADMQVLCRISPSSLYANPRR
jgi:hypothetical protein